MVDNIFLLVLEVTIAVRNGLHEFAVGDRLVVALDSLPLPNESLLCEKLEEMVPIPAKLIHQFPPDPLTAGDSKLDFGPHYVSRAALLWAVPLPDPRDISVLDLLGDLIEVLGTVKRGNSRFTTRENGDVARHVAGFRNRSGDHGGMING